MFMSIFLHSKVSLDWSLWPLVSACQSPQKWQLTPDMSCLISISGAIKMHVLFLYHFVPIYGAGSQTLVRSLTKFPIQRVPHSAGYCPGQGLLAQVTLHTLPTRLHKASQVWGDATEVKCFKATLGKEEWGCDVSLYCTESDSRTERKRAPSRRLLLSTLSSFLSFQLIEESSGEGT